MLRWNTYGLRYMLCYMGLLNAYLPHRGLDNGLEVVITIMIFKVRNLNWQVRLAALTLEVTAFLELLIGMVDLDSLVTNGSS